MLGGGQNLGLVQVGFAGAFAHQRYGFIGGGDVQAVAVFMGVNGNAADAHGFEGTDGADGDFASVGDEDFLEHVVWSPE